MRENSTPTGGEPDAPDPGVAPSPAGPMARREAALLDIVRRCLKEAHARHPAGTPPRSEQLFRLDLRVALDAGGWQVRFEPPLGEQVEEQVQEVIADLGVFRDGFVYCFKCASSACIHARPGDPGDVFAGYDPMGMPEWKSFAQALLDARDARIDRLYEKQPPVLARVQAGREMKARQLASFGRGSRAYVLMGQVIAGYFRRGSDGAGGFAVTFQAVQTFAADGTWELRLNTVMAMRVDEVLGDDDLDWLRRARDTARREFKRVEERARQARAARDTAGMRRALGVLPVLLNRLAQSIERGGRQATRRTRHASDRRQMRRPVHMAVADALSAKADRVYVDERTGGLVICGEQGRTHVFSREGRHVTSLVLPPGGPQARVRVGRWTEAAEEAVVQLQTAIRGQDGAP